MEPLRSDARIAVVVPTIGRPSLLVRTVRSILDGDLVPHRLVVLDQSSDPATAGALDPYLADGRIHHVPSARRGISAALNEAIEMAGADLVGILGDDCEAEPAWLSTFRSAFMDDPETGIAFGSILSAPHDRARGFIPTYQSAGPAVAHRLSQKREVSGTSACMAMRTDAWRALAGFDENLGVGAPLRSGEDTDLTIRALMLGIAVREVPRAEVVHHGCFLWDERAGLLERNWYGTGAAFAKAVRLGGLEAWRMMGSVGRGWFLGRSPLAAGMGGKPYRLHTLRAFARGFRVGLRFGLDRSTGHFHPLTGGSETPQKKGTH
jgi:GT2 family glycosyltransferase